MSALSIQARQGGLTTFGGKRRSNDNAKSWSADTQAAEAAKRTLKTNMEVLFEKEKRDKH